jgi:hypothetical protein
MWSYGFFMKFTISYGQKTEFADAAFDCTPQIAGFLNSEFH